MKAALALLSAMPIGIVAADVAGVAEVADAAGAVGAAADIADAAPFPPPQPPRKIPAEIRNRNCFSQEIHHCLSLNA